MKSKVKNLSVGTSYPATDRCRDESSLGQRFVEKVALWLSMQNRLQSD